MAEKRSYVRFLFGGGWATDFGPATDKQVADGILVLPFLKNAENVIYDFDGGPRKAPGTIRLNSSAMESGARVRGLFDAWFTGTSGSPAQHRIVHVSTKIKKDDADGTFTDIFTGVSNSSRPDYTMADDLLVIADDSNDVPRSWDASTAQNLSGSPPNFGFSFWHKNRLWAAGVNANASRLHYSPYLDATNASGRGWGHIDVQPNDGDRISAIWSHQDSLFVFKGPYEGSIHRIIGTAPTGGDAFQRIDFSNAKGMTAASQRCVFPFANDLGFVTPNGTFHTLSTTAAFGDFDQAALSRPIATWIREHVNSSVMEDVAQVVTWSEDYDIVLASLPIDSSTTNNAILMMDFRFAPVRWALWDDFTAASIVQVFDSGSANRNIVMAGSDDGFVEKHGQSTRTIAGGTGISYKVTTPHLTFGNPLVEKTLEMFSLGIQPRNDGNITAGFQRDDLAQDTVTIAQGGTSVLGTASANQFTLGTSTLGGARFVDRFRDLDDVPGEFRSIEFEVLNSVNNEDLELHSMGAIISVGSRTTEN